MSPTQQTLPHPSALIASLLSLMTRFSENGNASLAALIRHELALLQSYPEREIPPLLKTVAKRLEAEWQLRHIDANDNPAWAARSWPH